MAHNVLTIKNALVKLANTRATPTFTEFGDAIKSVTLKIESGVNVWEPVSGNNQQDVTAPKYTLELELGQDFATGSLWNYLLTNHGVKGKAEFYPKGGTTPKIAADVVIAAPTSAGGAGGEVATTSATLPCDGAATVTAG